MSVPRRPSAPGSPSLLNRSKLFSFPSFSFMFSLFCQQVFLTPPPPLLVFKTPSSFPPSSIIDPYSSRKRPNKGFECDPVQTHPEPAEIPFPPPPQVDRGSLLFSPRLFLRRVPTCISPDPMRRICSPPPPQGNSSPLQMREISPPLFSPGEDGLFSPPPTSDNVI